ncbi:hypothetical protein D5086_033693 [Populus alba]|uniref:Uncharacterized protein n=2 Tax=Populus TaxID=3689 RepID=A0ACC4AHI7_POPAL
MALLVVIPIFQLSVHLASNGCCQHLQLQVLNIPKPNACPVFNVPCTSASTTEFDAVAYEVVKQRRFPCLILESSDPWDSTSHSSSICCVDFHLRQKLSLVLHASEKHWMRRRGIVANKS